MFNDTYLTYVKVINWLVFYVHSYVCILYISIFIFSVKSRMATGYDAQGNEAFMYDLGWAAPAGQMYSTLNDLMKVHVYCT